MQDKRSTYYTTLHSCAFAVFYKQSPIVNYRKWNRFNHVDTNIHLLSLRMVCRQGRTAWFCVTSQTRQNGSSRETSSPLQVGMVSFLKLNAEWGPRRYKKRHVLVYGEMSTSVGQSWSYILVGYSDFVLLKEQYTPKWKIVNVFTLM